MASKSFLSFPPHDFSPLLLIIDNSLCEGRPRVSYIYDLLRSKWVLIVMEPDRPRIAAATPAMISYFKGWGWIVTGGNNRISVPSDSANCRPHEYVFNQAAIAKG